MFFFFSEYALSIVMKRIRQLKAIRGRAPIAKNKTAWIMINPEKRKEKAFRLLKSCNDILDYIKT